MALTFVILVTVGFAIMVVSTISWAMGYAENAAANRGNDLSFYVAVYAFLAGAFLFVVGIAGVLYLAAAWLIRGWTSRRS